MHGLSGLEDTKQGDREEGSENGSPSEEEGIQLLSDRDVRAKLLLVCDSAVVGN